MKSPSDIAANAIARAVLAGPDLMRRANSISATEYDIAYISRDQSERVREVVRGLLQFVQWQPASTAPKTGDHILVCIGDFHEHWTFNQSPPLVVHYWSNPGEEGFYQSSGIVEGSYNDKPVEFTHWRPLLGSEPR